MLCAKLPFRGSDAWGSGAFGASRNGRKHKGVDYKAEPGSYILSPCIGKISKVGYPYGWVENATNYRYVQITEDLTGLRHRVFYIDPLVYKGQPVGILSVIGIAQDISTRYIDPSLAPMTPHVHYEILDKDNNPLNPELHHV